MDLLSGGVDPPKIMFASTSSSLPNTMPMRTPLSVLDSYLTNANATQIFTMEFQFSKKWIGNPSKTSITGPSPAPTKTP